MFDTLTLSELENLTQLKLEEFVNDARIGKGFAADYIKQLEKETGINILDE